jgi:hypothetical protein
MGWANAVLLCWLWPIVRRGYSTPLQPSDLPTLPEDLLVRHARADGVAWWMQQLATGRRPSVLRMAWGCHRKELVCGLIFSLFYGLINVVLRPWLLKVTIDVVSGTGSNDSSGVADGVEVQLGEALRLVLAIGGSLLLEGIVGASSRHYLSDQVGTALFGKTAALIQRKAMLIDGSGSLSVHPSTLIGSDMVRCYEYSKMMALLPMCVGGIVGGFVLLVVTIGVAGIIGISVMILITLLNVELAKRIKKVERLEMEAGAPRNLSRSRSHG